MLFSDTAQWSAWLNLRNGQVRPTSWTAGMVFGGDDRELRHRRNAEQPIAGCAGPPLDVEPLGTPARPGFPPLFELHDLGLQIGNALPPIGGGNAFDLIDGARERRQDLAGKSQASRAEAARAARRCPNGCCRPIRA